MTIQCSSFMKYYTTKMGADKMGIITQNKKCKNKEEELEMAKKNDYNCIF